MKRFHLLFFILISFFMVSQGYAKNNNIQPKLELLGIKAIKTAEKDGEELYFHVTVYPSGGQPSFYRIPKFPMHWLSDQLDKIKQTRIWSHPLKPDDAVTLVVSLIEEDFPPWNTDDLIGSIRIHIQNKKGKLIASWSMPNRADAPIDVRTEYGPAKKFELLGEKTTYHVFLMLKK